MHMFYYTTRTLGSNTPSDKTPNGLLLRECWSPWERDWPRRSMARRGAGVQGGGVLLL